MMCRLTRCILLGYILTLKLVHPLPIQPAKQNETVTEKVDVINVSSQTLNEKLRRFSQCTLTPTSPKLSADIKEKLDSGARLIHLYLTVIGHTGVFPGELQSVIYKPLRWTRSTGKVGRGLMMLNNAYNVLSMNTLNYEVENMYNITLTQNPTKCLSSMDIHDAEEYLRRFLLNDARGIIFNETEKFVGNTNQEICNFHIDSKGEYYFGYFHYECCHVNEELELVCGHLKPNIWIIAIITCVFTLNMVIIFFSPYFVPTSFYQSQREPMVYEHELKTPKSILVKKTTNSKSGSDNVIHFENISNQYMPKFNKLLDSKCMDMDTVYSLTVSKLRFYVPADKLLSTSSAPVGLLRACYDRLFLCNVSKEEQIYSCCKSRMKPFQKYSWQSCLRRLMHTFLLLLAIVPWVIRIVLYYTYEERELSDMKEAASIRRIDVYYAQASFALRYLTPVHVVFIVCYLIIVLDSFFLGLLFKEYIYKFKRVVTQSLNDMDAYKRYSTFEWMLTILTFPLEKIGLFAIPLMPFYWIIMIVSLLPMLLYYFVPTINIFIRLILYWSAHLCPSFPFIEKIFRKSLGDSDENPIGLPWRKRLFEFFVVSMCLLTLSSFLFLAAECITFAVEVIIYTAVGVILNAEVTLKYVSLFLMLTLYTRDTFGEVTRVYKKFNESLINAVRKIEDKQVEDLGICDKNVALTAQDMGDINETTPDINIRDNELRWKIYNVFIFIDKKRNAFRISKNFFFNAIHMDVDGCPGYLFPNFMKAIRRLLLIVLFLMFVFLVVSAFGDQYEVSGVSQMLATLVGGFLPWIISNFLFQNSTNSNCIDPECVTFSTFKRFLYEEVSNFEQSWPVMDFDCEPENLTKCEKKTSRDCDIVIVYKTPKHSKTEEPSETDPMKPSPEDNAV